MEGKKLVAKIKSMAVSKGMKMNEFYQMTGITGGAMSQWKSGETSPSMASLQRIAAVLKTTVAEIVETEETKTPATENGSGRYGLSKAQWKQIGSLFRTKLLSIPKAPAWLATEQTGLSEADVEEFFAGERYVTKAQIHAMAALMDLTLWDIIGAYAMAFDGEEDVEIAKREEFMRLAASLLPAELDQVIAFAKGLITAREFQDGGPKAP